MRKTEVGKGAGLRKIMGINEACAVKSSLVAVHIIRRTELSIGRTRIAAGNAMAVAGPGPAHCITHRDVSCVRHKHKPPLPDCYIYNLTGT